MTSITGSARRKCKSWLRHGDPWLASHPEREQIVYRYLKHFKYLANDALARLIDGDAEETETAEERHAGEEEQVERKISLNEHRLNTVISELRAARAKRILDLGCSNGNLVKRLLEDKQFEQIVGLDVSHRALEIAADRLHLDRLPERQRQRIQPLHGSLIYRDRRLEGFDAAAVVEVIEHLDEPRLAAFERMLFEFAKPATVIVTTPNVEYNVRFETLPAGQFRHKDHRFEWTRKQFEDWAGRIAQKFNYAVRLNRSVRRIREWARRHKWGYSAVETDQELQLREDGFFAIDRCLDDQTIDSLIAHIEQDKDDQDDTPSVRRKRGVAFARRNLLSTPLAQSFLRTDEVRGLRSAIGAELIAVRAILFDKTGSANWTVPWHQDRSIAVRERKDTAGFGPWSNKAGVVHVQPPFEILTRMITLRFSLDPCDADNGPLRVIPGTDHGILDPAALEERVRQGSECQCTTAAGGVVIMRPLVLHASSPPRRMAHRRVLHIEFGPPELPGGLQWASV